MRRLAAAIARHPLLLALVVANVAVKIWLWPRTGHASFTGDEIYYHEAGQAIADLMRQVATFQAPDTTLVRDSLVSDGSFLPGNAILLAPLYLLSPHADAATTRLYLGVLTTVALFALAVFVHRRLGARAAGLLLVTGCVPMWAQFSYALWADLMAGLVLVVLVLELLRVGLDWYAGRPLRLRTGVWIGVLAAGLLYLRSSSLPASLGALALLLVGTLLLGRATWRRSLVAAALACVVFVALLAPWSVTASHYLGARVVTTTTLPLSRAVAFGHVDDVCFGPCPPGSIWTSSIRYSRGIAALTGQSEVDVQREMSAYALRDSDLRSWIAQVRGDFGRFVFKPGGFARRFEARPAPPADSTHIRLVTWPTVVLYGALLVAFALALLVVVRRGVRDQLALLLLKLFGAAALVQPFVHISSGRYWPSFAPLLAVMAAVLLDLARPGRRAEPGLRILTVAQALVTGLVAVVAAVVLLG
ncbi:hypothetical protein GCM10009798_23560 [Nocardioides panacihumi]|uniref:Glycosyltransferase RgtA/B/C/D-like domain-containing protein n=1 Tax=Nocardioides panacihumi TaxID=400774 RepID=A0ABP5CG56_9ACTN